jgi:hypothetical protein
VRMKIGEKGCFREPSTSFGVLQYIYHLVKEGEQSVTLGATQPPWGHLPFGDIIITVTFPGDPLQSEKVTLQVSYKPFNYFCLKLNFGSLRSRTPSTSTCST